MNTPSARKNTKVNTGPNKKTLDVQHINKLNSFQELESQQNDLKAALKELETKLSLLTELKRTSGLSNEQFHEYIRLVDERDEIEKDIEKLGDEIDEVDYYVNTGSILFQYYDILEKGANDEDPINKVSVNDKSILKFFIKPNEVEEEKKDVKDDRASLLDKYLAATDEGYMRSLQTDSKDCCRFCGSSNMSLLLNDGMIYCNDCSSIEHITIDHDRPSYRDPPREITYFAYKRINHLNECISQIQGKETTDIPSEVYDAILLEIKKQKISNMAELTPKKLRAILKKLKLNKYYEHLNFLHGKLTGLAIPHLDAEMEERIRMMFKLVQPAFLKHAPLGRKNFLSYNYILHKFVQLLERDEYLEHFTLLKSREKLHEQDKVWAKICAELNWQFIPSI